MGPVLTFDTGDARTGAGQLPQYFAKFSPAGVTSPFVARGEHTVGSQITEVSRLLTRLRRAKEVSEAVRR